MNNKVFKNLSYGVYIVSCFDGQKYTGCTVNSLMQVASDPAIIALSVNKENYTHSCIENNKKIAVSILAENSNPLSIGTFGFRSSRNFDKFSVVDYILKDNLPVVKDACAYLICEITNKVETQTHSIFLAQVTDGDILNENAPMTYAYYHNVIKGKTPKSAPTFIQN